MASFAIKFNGIRNQKTNIRRFIGCSFWQGCHWQKRRWAVENQSVCVKFLDAQMGTIIFDRWMCMRTQSHNEHKKRNKHLNCLMVRFYHWVLSMAYSAAYDSTYICCTRMMYCDTLLCIRSKIRNIVYGENAKIFSAWKPINSTDDVCLMRNVRAWKLHVMQHVAFESSVAWN